MKIKELEQKVLSQNLPNHIGIILDGNGRFAASKNMPRIYGHSEGVKRVEEIIDYSLKIGIKELSLFCFSTENIKRDQEEVLFLFDLFKKTYHHFNTKYQNKGIKFRVIGETFIYDEEILNIIGKVNNIKLDEYKMMVNICFNYGSRQEIINMVKQITTNIKLGKENKDDIDENMIKKYLYIPSDLDLIIRTSGEMRLSNFMLFQASYAELYFSKCYWPEFNKKEYLEAIDAFSHRQRRFGGIK